MSVADRVEEQLKTVIRRLDAHKPKLPPKGKPPSARGTIVTCTSANHPPAAAPGAGAAPGARARARAGAGAGAGARARAAAVAAAEAAVRPSDCFPNNSHVGHGWNDSAAKFRAAYGLMDQGHDNLTRPDFDGCDHAFACTLCLLLYP